MSIGRYIVALTVACATAGCAMDDVVMDLNSTSNALMEGGGTQFGATIDGVMWHWNVSWRDVKDTPDWVPGKEPAVSMPKAIELAQIEMTKYADSPDAYELDGVEWLAITECCNSSRGRKWIYVVNFERMERFQNGSRGTIRIPVLLDGRAIEGKKELPR